MDKKTTSFGAVPQRISSGFVSRLKRFEQDETGGIIIFVLINFMLMVVAAGMAVDFIRHEVVRAELQDALDRGVLAAAAFSQDLSPQQTVEGYLRTTLRLGSDLVPVVALEEVTGEYRRVTASASVLQKTIFLKIIGFNELTIAASGTAEQHRFNTEISLVLDVSTSMADGGKMTSLRAAAKEFIDTVLTDETRPFTSISIVPYAGQVNPGADLFAQMNISTMNAHNYSTCVDFTTSEFSTTALAPILQRKQMQHFQYSRYTNSYPPPTGTGWGWCPQEVGTTILPFSNDNNALKARIDSLELHEATGTQYGMKWGTGLLDPSFQPAITALIGSGQISGQMAGRPAAFDDASTKKIIIIMTDGMITQQFRIKNSYYNSSSEREFWERQNSGWSYNNYLSSYYSSRLEWRSTQPGTYIGGVPSSASELYDICDSARSNQMIVFAIGFQVPSGSAEMMRDCASSPSHYISVSNLDIAEAFNKIARSIDNVKLVN